MKFDPGFTITPCYDRMVFDYGEDVFGPKVEHRLLQDIRQSLKDPQAFGPEILYAIAMDIGEKKDRADLIKRNLLYGAVQYSQGRIGEEPIRSQGHSHALSTSCNSSTPEVYEIWEGTAIIYMQETAKDFPGRCFAITAEVGEVVIVPPNWAHCTINGNSRKNMSFGAWCVRDYAFDYEGIRNHHGIAYFPTLNQQEQLEWQANPAYQTSSLTVKAARSYPEFGLSSSKPIYTQYQQNPNLFSFVTQPQSAKNLWTNFQP